MVDLLLKLIHAPRGIERVDLEPEALFIHGQKGHGLEVPDPAEHGTSISDAYSQLPKYRQLEATHCLTGIEINGARQ